MTATNDITGDSIQTRVPNENYLNNHDAIFRGNYKVVYLLGSSTQEYETQVIASSSVSARRHFNEVMKSSVQPVTIVDIFYIGK